MAHLVVAPGLVAVACGQSVRRAPPPTDSSGGALGTAGSGTAGIGGAAKGGATRATGAGGAQASGSAGASRAAGSANGGAAGAPSSCVVDGISHAPGSRWAVRDGCNWCLCLDSGLAACTAQSCETGGEGGAPWDNLGQAGEEPGCSYNDRGYAQEGTFLAVDGCNQCTCDLGFPVCTQTACTPECQPAAIGELCVTGVGAGGPQGFPDAHFEIGDQLVAQLAPRDCFPVYCGEFLVNTASVEPTPNSDDFIVRGAFCYAADPSCSMDSPNCATPGSGHLSEARLTAGTHRITVEGTELSLTIEVPSVIPFEQACVRIAP